MDQNERRSKRRIVFKGEISIKRISGDTPVSVDVFDLSSRGLGFISPEPCEIGVTYESTFKIWTGEMVHVFFEVVRISRVDDTENILYSCGAYFIGLSQMDTKKLEVYECVDETVEGMSKNQ